jgi:hypothetical protein
VFEIWWEFHFTPTSASCSPPSRASSPLSPGDESRRGAFASVANLQDVITRYIAAHNKASKPFGWTLCAIVRPNEL